MHTFNANWQLAEQLRQMILDSGQTLKKVVAYRDKVMGFMGSRGEYVVGDCMIDSYGHYNDENDERHFSLRFYKGKPSGCHLVADDQKRVWFSPSGMGNFCDINPNDLTDLEPTPFILK